MPSIMVGLISMRERSLHLARKTLEVQAKRLMLNPTSMRSNQISISININIPFRISIRIHTQIHPNKLSNLEDILTHWVFLYMSKVFDHMYARGVISNDWTQFLHRTCFRSIGTRTCISISIRGQDTILMIVPD